VSCVQNAAAELGSSAKVQAAAPPALKAVRQSSDGDGDDDDDDVSKRKKKDKKKSKREKADDAAEGVNGGVTASLVVEDFDDLAAPAVTLVHLENGSALVESPSRQHTLRCFVLQTLRKCFANDSESSTDRDRVSLLVDALMAMYTLPVAAAHAAARGDDSDDDSDSDGDGSRKKRKRRGDKKARAKKKAQVAEGVAAAAVAAAAAAASGVVAIPALPGGDAYSSFVHVYIIPTVCQLALSAGDSHNWKAVNTAVRSPPCLRVCGSIHVFPHLPVSYVPKRGVASVHVLV
jgi:hypothetical protein